MHASAMLRSLPCRLTLFVRSNCSLCDDAKVVLSRVWDRKPFHYDEVDVMAPGNGRWKDIYEFDTPVVHIDKENQDGGSVQTKANALKLMHRFKQDQIEALMDKAVHSGTPS